MVERNNRRSNIANEKSISWNSSCKVSIEKAKTGQHCNLCCHYEDFETVITFEQGAEMTFAMTLDL